MSGFVAGSIAAGVTTPLDVIKTRLQVQSKQATSNMHQFYYKNGIDAFFTILKQEGPSAFGKGMTARILWIAPGTAITIACCMFMLLLINKYKYGRPFLIMQ